MQYRTGQTEDLRALYQIFGEALGDLLRRSRHPEAPPENYTAWIDHSWPSYESLYQHLTESAYRFVVAEEGTNIVGFARSILRCDLLQLTELFVAPNNQSGGVGRELLLRVFPHEAAQDLSIIATSDMRAQVLYLNAGVLPRSPLHAFTRSARILDPVENLEVLVNDSRQKHLDLLDQMDRKILGHSRRPDHLWLLSDRAGLLYRAGGEWVGYGYVGNRSGPFALLNDKHFPDVLADAETRAAQRGSTSFELEVPLVNGAAVRYLLAQGFRIDPFAAQIMTNRDFARLEHYIVCNSPYFL